MQYRTRGSQVSRLLSSETLSSRARQPPTEWWISQPADNLAAAGAVSHQESASYKQALRSPQAEQWKAAMEIEYDALTSRETWRLVPRPARRKLVDSKWVYNLKRNPDRHGSIARYKARLVARGFTQEHGVDYHETFAPTVKVVSRPSESSWHWRRHGALRLGCVEQMDVVTAFLEADIAEDIYMRQPSGPASRGAGVFLLPASLAWDFRLFGAQPLVSQISEVATMGEQGVEDAVCLL